MLTPGCIVYALIMYCDIMDRSNLSVFIFTGANVHVFILHIYIFLPTLASSFPKWYYAFLNVKVYSMYRFLVVVIKLMISLWNWHCQNVLIFSAESKVVAVLLRCREGGWINHQNDNQRRNGEDFIFVNYYIWL